MTIGNQSLTSIVICGVTIFLIILIVLVGGYLYSKKHE